MTPLQRAAVGTGAIVIAVTPFVSKWEGRKNDPYYDIGGVLTVCDGETRNVEQRRYSNAECDRLLQASLTEHAEGVLPCLPPEAPMSVKMAFVSFGYNAGVTGACGSKAAQRARARDYPAACATLASSYIAVRARSLQAWNTCPADKRRLVNGIRYCVSQGLLNRRAAERQLCEQGIRS